MAAVTTTIAAGVSLAGLGMSVGQAVKANSQAKQANNAATAAATAFQNIREQNAFSKVQVPTLGFDLAQQGIDRTAQSALSTLQGAGAEGVIGGVGQVMQGINANELDLSQQALEAKYNRDVMEANAQQGINQRQAVREEDLALMRLQGAQRDQYQAQLNKQQAIRGAFGSASSALGAVDKLVPLYQQKKAGVVPVTTTTDDAIYPQQEFAQPQRNYVQYPPAQSPSQQMWGNEFYSLGYPQQY